MALNSLGLGLLLTAKDLASGKVAGLARSMSGLDAATLRAQAGFTRNMGAMAASLGVLTAGGVALAGALGLANVAGEFGQNLARVGAISRASASDMLRLRDAAIEAGIETQFSPVQTVQGLESLASQGFSAAESMRLLKPALYLAEGGMISVESATAATTSAVKVFGLSVEDAVGNVAKGIPSVADKLLAISNATSLTARDLELALGTVGRGAIVTGQSLDEMLISMGLVKNTGLDASVAAQSVSSALVFVAKQAKGFKEIGVEVTDASGKFRPFLDIIQETADAFGKRYKDQAVAAAEATKLFSRFGLSAFAAISKQVATGVKDMSGNILKGAEAVAYLRKQMAESSGVAKEFQDRVLNTYRGQVTLLRGVVETLEVVLGEGFAEALKPAVTFVKDALTSVTLFVNSLPAEFRTFLSQAVLVAGGLVAVVGAVLSAATAFAVIAPFFKAGLVALGGTLAALMPFALGLAAVGAAFYALKVAVDRNLGGIGDAWQRFAGGVALAFRGLLQLFSEGGFSGAVREEMRRAENSGVRRFVLGLFLVAHRVAQFFRGVWHGLSAAMDAAAPTFARLGESLTRLGRALGFVGDEGVTAVANVRSLDFALWGARLGRVLGFLVDVFAQVWTAFSTYLGGVVEGFGAVMARLSPVFSSLGDAFGMLAGQFFKLLEQLGFGVAKGASFADVFLFLGRVVGGVVAGAVGVLSLALTGVSVILSGVLLVVRKLAGAFLAAGAVIGRVATAVGDWIGGMVDSAVADFGKLLGAVPSFLRPAGSEVVIEAGKRAEARIAEKGERGLIPGVLGALSEPTTAAAAGAVEEARARREQAATSATSRVAEMVLQQRQDFEKRATVVNLTVDGQKLATAVVKSDRAQRRASFLPAESEG